MHRLFKCQNCGTKYDVNDESEHDVSICKWCDEHYHYDETKDTFVEVALNE
mgnify:CR=1 FL=1